MGVEPIRVLIVDDYELFANALEMWLHGRDGIEVVGIARDGAEAVDLALAKGADVVLMDLGLPTMDGLEATRRLLAIKPAARVIVVTGQTEDEGKEAALNAGAIAYVTKGGIHEHINAAIQQAVNPTPIDTPLQ